MPTLSRTTGPEVIPISMSGDAGCRWLLSSGAMDTHRLKYFLRIAEEGSITRAAALTGIA